jgi:succinate-acetate transporter protein
MTVGALKVSRCLSFIFITLIIALFFLVVGTFTYITEYVLTLCSKTPGLNQAGGWVGLICAFAAWYNSAAGIINLTWGREVLPLGHLRTQEEKDKALSSLLCCCHKEDKEVATP